MNYLLVLLSMLFISNPAHENSKKVNVTQDVTEIVIEANDKMQFNLSEIKVPAGTTVKLTLKHVGKLPKQSMGHNFVLLKQGIKMKDFAMTAMAARDNDYIPKNTDDIITHTDLVGGGESTTIEFEAPKKGEYTFICSFPGHFSLMNGKFIVE